MCQVFIRADTPHGPTYAPSIHQHTPPEPTRPHAHILTSNRDRTRSRSVHTAPALGPAARSARAPEPELAPKCVSSISRHQPCHCKPRTRVLAASLGRLASARGIVETHRCMLPTVLFEKLTSFMLTPLKLLRSKRNGTGAKLPFQVGRLFRSGDAVALLYMYVRSSTCSNGSSAHDPQSTGHVRRAPICLRQSRQCYDHVACVSTLRSHLPKPPDISLKA